jgi:ribosome-interacting GTPase 1
MKFGLFIVQKKSGGLHFTHTVPLTQMDEKLIYTILHEYKIHNAEVCFRGDYGFVGICVLVTRIQLVSEWMTLSM